MVVNMRDTLQGKGVQRRGGAVAAARVHMCTGMRHDESELWMACGAPARPPARPPAHAPAVAQLGEGQDVEVAQQAVADRIAAAAWGPHGCHKLRVHQRAEAAGRLALKPAGRRGGEGAWQGWQLLMA
jgi:hypothetical protein